MQAQANQFVGGELPPPPFATLACAGEARKVIVDGSYIIDQLRRNLAIMNAHWEDYERLFVSGKR